ncbi:hypothetical protein [Actinomadura atramentaria]|uniref:hypothetical protein n=1 Tax=Actinomadura atramentaria TaxID=1990 RepID=UPI00037B969F|nr:hypothetical protein [Actinomadura atramentaria]
MALKITGLTIDQHRAATEYLEDKNLEITRTTITFNWSDPLDVVDKALSKPMPSRGYPRQPLMSIRRKVVKAIEKQMEAE